MLVEDLKLLNAYMNNKKVRLLPERNKLTGFTCYGPVYPFTNEMLSKYPMPNLNGKKTLSVTSSGDHILLASYLGSENITGFDINRFSKYYAALKIALIKACNYDNFIKLISMLTAIDSYDPKYRYFQYDTFNKVFSYAYQYLNLDEITFFNTFLELYNNINKNFDIRFFRYELSNISLTFYNDENNYYKLRRCLMNCEINYVDSNISKLPKVLDDKFDAIYISNIIHRLNKNSDKNKYKTLIKLYPLLNHEGMLFDYSWNEITYDKYSKINKYFYVEKIRTSNESTIDYVNVFTKK